MDKSRRKEILQAYKERPRAIGVFAVRCAASGEAWVSASRNLDTQANGLWFTLRHGSHPNRALQAAFNAHGADALSYEPLETVETEGLSAYEIANRLKDLEAKWRAELNAGAVTG